MQTEHPVLRLRFTSIVKSVLAIRKQTPKGFELATLGLYNLLSIAVFWLLSAYWIDGATQNWIDLLGESNKVIFESLIQSVSGMVPPLLLLFLIVLSLNGAGYLFSLKRFERSHFEISQQDESIAKPVTQLAHEKPLPHLLKVFAMAILITGSGLIFANVMVLFLSQAASFVLPFIMLYCMSLLFIIPSALNHARVKNQRFFALFKRLILFQFPMQGLGRFRIGLTLVNFGIAGYFYVSLLSLMESALHRFAQSYTGGLDFFITSAIPGLAMTGFQLTTTIVLHACFILGLNFLLQCGYVTYAMSQEVMPPLTDSEQP